MARVIKMARGNISLAHGFQCYPNFLLLLPDQRLYIVKNMSIYIHIYDGVETVYELPLLPNNTASETFLHKSGAVRGVNWIVIIGAPAWRWLVEYVILHRTFYGLLFLKYEVIAATVTATFYVAFLEEI